MTVDITFHYPPDLLKLLVDAIPLLNRSKKDVFDFFKGAGISHSLVSTPYLEWQRDHDSISKFEIVRQVLVGLNERGEACLRERRETLRRVTEFENFTVCWPEDQLKAKGLVAEIRSLVNVKDSFTRMSLERERERQERVEMGQAQKTALRRRQEAIEKVRQDLSALFFVDNPHQRGKALEDVLNRLFSVFGIGVRASFALIGNANQGVVEQLDGVVELDGHTYFVEMKWWNSPLGVHEISEHLVRIYQRADGRAIIISASEFTAPAIAICKDALQTKVVVLCTLQEFVFLLEQQGDLKDFLKKKVQAAVIEKNPYSPYQAT